MKNSKVDCLRTESWFMTHNKFKPTTLIRQFVAHNKIIYVTKHFAFGEKLQVTM